VGLPPYAKRIALVIKYYTAEHPYAYIRQLAEHLYPYLASACSSGNAFDLYSGGARFDLNRVTGATKIDCFRFSRRYMWRINLGSLK
jgi:hypothetical protein